jgi:hypothetical protein
MMDAGMTSESRAFRTIVMGQGGEDIYGGAGGGGGGDTRKY